MAGVLISTSSKFIQSQLNSSFRPIYYLGCKNSFTAAIKSAINDVSPSGGRLVDLFAGTGSVGVALSSDRDVTTVDVQEYSRVLCAALLNPSNLTESELKSIVVCISGNEITKKLFWCFQPLIDYEQQCIVSAINGDSNALVELIESPPLAIRDTSKVENLSNRLNRASNDTISRLQEVYLLGSATITTSRYFGGLYFSYAQSVMFDAILSFADSLNEQNCNTLKAAVLSTASQLVNTVGKQFAQPIQPRNKSGEVKPNLLRVVHRDRTLNALDIYQVWLRKYASLPRTLGTHKSLRQDYLEALNQHSSTFSVVYADPPYTRDHYSRFYHVLETMCLRDNPEISQVMKNGNLEPSRGAYREYRHQSDFCIRSTAPAAFESLFRKVRECDLPMVLSYSPYESNDGTHPRVVSMSQIIEIANQYYNRIEVDLVDGITHNQLNRSGLKLKEREQAEVLLKCYR